MHHANVHTTSQCFPHYQPDCKSQLASSNETWFCCVEILWNFATASCPNVWVKLPPSFQNLIWGGRMGPVRHTAMATVHSGVNLRAEHTELIVPDLKERTNFLTLYNYQCCRWTESVRSVEEKHSWVTFIVFCKRKTEEQKSIKFAWNVLGK